jgi:glycosyltransferase involved in cell wall biosynthesis
MAGLQLIVPCYDEAGRFVPGPYAGFLADTPDAALLFVDDGSSDRTPALLAEFCAGSGGHASVLTLPRNLGKAEAVRRGIVRALEESPHFVGYWDADLSTPLDAVRDFLTVLQADRGVNIVIGSRVRLLGRHINRRVVRHYSGRAFATAASLALGIGVYDTQCGAKIFRVNEWLARAFAEPFQSRWLFDVEILARYVASTGRESAEFSICEYPLKAWSDVPGSKLSAWQGLRAAWDLARIWRRYATSRCSSRLP